MKKDFIIRLILVIPIAIIMYWFGFKPLLGGGEKPPQFKPPKNDTTWTAGKLAKDPDQYDVIVAGEEPEGIAAAVTAARLGAKTLLISEREDLGGVVSRSLLADMESSRGAKGELLNRNVLSDLFNAQEGRISVDKYVKGVTELVNSEKKLEVVYNAKINSPVMNASVITGLNVTAKSGQSAVYKGKRIIDATRDGKVLTLCKVPHFYGSEDLNMKSSYLPVRLNFEVEGIEWDAVQKLSAPKNQKFYDTLREYDPSQPNIRLSNFYIADQGSGKAIIQGIELFGVNVTDNQAMAEAYTAASKEAEELAKFLKVQFKEFGGVKISRIASELYVRESIHFKGEHLLSVNEILENTDFDNKIALGSYPVEAGKFTTPNSRYLVGKPAQYGIPFACSVPLGVDNLLMVGSKISYSSLASSSAATLDNSITVGDAASVAAVYSIVQDLTPRDIARLKNIEKIKKLQELLTDHGLNLPNFKIDNSNAANWSYPAVKQLCSLGLIAGGAGNNYKFDLEAKQFELIIPLISGTSRLSPEKYTLDLHARLQPYYTADKLSKEKAAEILLAFHGTSFDKGKAFEAACASGYIDEFMQRKLKNKKDLTMDDIYYLISYNLKLFTGTEIKG